MVIKEIDAVAAVASEDINHPAMFYSLNIGDIVKAKQVEDWIYQWKVAPIDGSWDKSNECNSLYAKDDEIVILVDYREKDEN